MKKKIYSAVILLSLVAPALALAGDENKAEVNGSIALGAMGVNVNGDKARFQEFSDQDDSILGEIQLDYLKGAYYFQFDAIKPGLDDQSYQLKGGEYGNFKYKLNYDEMPHNYTFDAIMPYTGLGTQNITVTTLANTATWTKFDYSVDHKSYGGELEVSLGSPFYVNVGAEKREQNGLRPYSAVLNHTNGSRSFAEVPEPISNTTDDLHLKAGYLGESLSASVTGYLSSFNNDNKYFQVGNEATAAGQVDKNIVLAPDNEYRKLAADLSWRDLPLGSALAAGLSHANLQNDFTASDINYNAGMLGTLTSLNRTTFEGDIDYTNASIALSSRPLDKLDSKIYYNYTDRDNKSSVISYGLSTASTNNAKELLSYEKNSAGIDLGYRLPNKTKLDAGYEYLKTDRSTALPAFSSYTSATSAIVYRYDNSESTTDDTLFFGLKNSALDWLTAKIKYTRLNRDSDINLTNVVTLAQPLYTTRFDTADKTMDQWKLSFELYPADNIDLGLNYTYTHNNYDWNNSSINDDNRQNVYADFTWRALETVTLSGFAGFEKTESDANKRTSLGLTPVRIETTNDDFWTYGLAANIAATDKLSFNLSWQHDDSDGAIDITSLNSTTYTNVTESDDYTKKRLEAKATYAIDPKLNMTVGYLYEKLEYKDYTYNDSYANIVANAGQGITYYSGLYADPNYEANVGYVMLSYGF